ncbi:G-protein coupled receptor GRL101-like protein [Trichoplax sp. H2]|nr:G-protein coupled receptor GRL101-like protein [Trichoplax sp. H2]|eukprot:RDD39574.1 G-protein coupled receptor GRL101-like protein [Trichoplax sp. H2]
MASLLYNNYAALAITWLFSIIGLIANPVVLVKVIRVLNPKANAVTKSIRHRKILSSRYRIFYILIVNLAISDTLGSFYLLIIAAADLHYRSIPLTVSKHFGNFLNSSMVYEAWINDPFCYIGRFLYILSIHTSTCITVIIASDRFVRLFYPFSGVSPVSIKAVTIAISITWLSSIVLGITGNIIAYNTTLPPYRLSYRYHNVCIINYLRHWSARFLLLIMSTSGGTMYGLVMFFYIMILCKLRSARNRIFTSRVKYCDPQYEYKVLFIAVILSFTNLVAMLPTYAVGISSYFDFTFAEFNDYFYSLVIIFVLFLQSNCCINPVIFLLSIYGKSITCRKLR